MSIIRLYHGSDHIIKTPSLSLAKDNNDFGRGFYCTRDLELAKEWSCKSNVDGSVNEYDLNDENLNVLNLLDDKYSILNWIAILLREPPKTPTANFKDL